jgi:hypothetical protein
MGNKIFSIDEGCTGINWGYEANLCSACLSGLIQIIVLIIFQIDRDLRKHVHNTIYKMVIFSAFILSCKYIVGSLAYIYKLFDCVCEIEGYIFTYIYLAYFFWKFLWIIDLHISLNRREAPSENRLLLYSLIGFTGPAVLTLLLLFASPVLPHLMARVTLALSLIHLLI